MSSKQIAVMRRMNRNRPINRQTKLNKRQVIQVKRVVNRGRELKFFPSFVNTTAVTSTPTFTGSPFDVAQGVLDTQRIGDRLQWAGKIEIRVAFACADTSNLIRFICLQWHPTSTVTSPAVADILLNGPSGVPDVYSVYNHDQRQNYKILLDRSLQMISPVGATATDTSVLFRHYRISLKKAKKDVQYNAGGLQAANRILLLYVSDSTLPVDPTITYTTKIFFRDS